MLMRAIYYSIETLVNGYIRLDPDSAAQLPQFSGKTLAVVFEGIEITCYVHCTPTRIKLQETCVDEVQASLTGTPLTLLRLLKSQQKTPILFSGDVTVSGDMDFVQALSTFFERLDVDWEEQLSKILGDMCAHHIGNAARQVQGVWRKLRETVTQNTTEYLQEEVCFIPAREALNDFFDDVDQLRDAVERLDARIQRLVQRAQL